jgi:hypothetical protein
MPSIRNVTDPVGMPADGASGLTLAAKVIACPKAAGFAEETSVVVLAP